MFYKISICNGSGDKLVRFYYVSYGSFNHYTYGESKVSDYMCQNLPCADQFHYGSKYMFFFRGNLCQS